MTKRSSFRHAQEVVRKSRAEVRHAERMARKAAKRERHKAAPTRAQLGMAAEARADGRTP
jgi:hypothetical protein